MRLLIAERSPILRKRLTRLFSDLEYLTMVSFVEEIAHVQQKAMEEKPDIIVINIDFPSRIYLKMLTILKNEINQSKIIVLTETTEPRYIGQFQNSGADMVFNKEDDLNKFVAYLNIMDGVVKEQRLRNNF